MKKEFLIYLILLGTSLLPSLGFAQNHPEVKSVLNVPIRSEDEMRCYARHLPIYEKFIYHGMKINNRIIFGKWPWPLEKMKTTLLNLIMNTVAKPHLARDLKYLDRRFGEIGIGSVLILNHSKNISQDQAIPLKQVHFIHPVNWERAQNELRQRIESLTKFKSTKPLIKEFSLEKLQEILPSSEAPIFIKVSDDSYLVMNGNGRVAALKEVYRDDEEQILIHGRVKELDPAYQEMVKDILYNIGFDNIELN